MLNLTRISEPFIFTIFGASGDLAKLKIFPALYELAHQKRFPENYSIVGYARSKKSQDQFKSEFEASIREAFKENLNDEILKELLNHVSYVQGQYDSKEDFEKMIQELKKSHKDVSTPFIAYYSVPPIAFEGITNALAHFNDSYKIRLIIEKPFGENEEGAKKLFATIQKGFKEEQVYLLDHYLGKEAVQSIVSLRHSNAIINHLLKGEYIDYIQITAQEEIGIKERGRYFDEIGIIKDMIQSHLLQLLALLTADLPSTLTAEEVQNKKAEILSNLTFNKDNFLIKGQYKSYIQEEGIDDNSKTETYAALKLFLDKTGWDHIPIYIRTGKKVDHKHTYLTVVFKKLESQKNIENLRPNKIIFELQPKANLYFKITNKRGGTYEEFKQIMPSQSLECYGDDCLPEHGRLLMDALTEKRMHFLSFEEVINSWKLIDKVLKEGKDIPLEIYEDGTEGPENQTCLFETPYTKWHHL